MFALTILYCLVFFYIRLQLKHLRKASDHQEIDPQDKNWQANLETRISSTPIPPQEIRTTMSVTVTTSDRSIRKSLSRTGDKTHRRMNRVTFTLLGYPLLYISLTMPLCIVRLSEFAGRNWGYTGIYIGGCIFTCTGFCNVLLYTLTRKGIVSWRGMSKRKVESIQLEENPKLSPARSKHVPHSSGSLRTIEPSVLSTITSVPLASPSTVGGIRSEDSDFGNESDYYETATCADCDKQVHDASCRWYPLREGMRSPRNLGEMA
jgi:hypothetical protein